LAKKTTFIRANLKGNRSSENGLIPWDAFEWVHCFMSDQTYCILCNAATLWVAGWCLGVSKKWWTHNRM